MVSLLPVRSWVNGRCCSPATNANIAVDRSHRQWSSSASSAGVILVVRGQMRSAKLQASSSSSSKVGVIIVDAVSLGVRLMVSKVGSRSLGRDRWVKIVGSRLGSRSNVFGVSFLSGVMLLQASLSLPSLAVVLIVVRQSQNVKPVSERRQGQRPGKSK